MTHKILLVEDDEFLRELFRMSLEMEGYDVIVAEHGGAAIEYIQHSPPDAVISDLQMPVIDGIQFARWLREQAGLDLPLLVITSMGNQATAEDVLKAGANDILFKPVEIEVIVAHLKKLLDARG